MRIPAALIGGATSQVFYERTSRERRDPAALRRLLGRTILGLSLLILPPMAFVAVVGPPLFGLVFGANWETAGEFARFVTIAAAFTFVASPVSRLPSVLRQQHKHLGISLLGYAGRFGGLWVGVLLGSPVLAVLLSGLAEAGAILIFFGWLWRYVSRMNIEPDPVRDPA